LRVSTTKAPVLSEMRGAGMERLKD
jgi:hypothetical protein